MVEIDTRLIYYGYIIYPRQENIVPDAQSRLPVDGNKYYIDKSTYTTENMSKSYNIEELSEGTFPLTFKIIDHQLWEYPGLMVKLKCATYKLDFRRGRNNAQLVLYKDKIVVPFIHQRYEVRWYHTYLLRTV